MPPVEDVLWGLGVLFVTLWAFQWFLHISSVIYGKWKLNRKIPNLSPENPLANVSILKPLSGVDANLYDNVETFFNLEFPSKYELLFCVQDDSDPAVMVINSLIKKYPKVDAKLFIGDEHIGPNPKINNMIKGYRQAKYELLLVSDAGIRMKRDTLTDLVCSMTETVGLVFQLPFVSDRKGFAPLLEMVYFGTHAAKFALVCEIFNITCVTGMSCLMRKNVLDEAGGLEIYADYLAEDHFFAHTIKSAGYKLRLGSQPALQNHGNSTVSKFQDRISRWARLRAATAPGTRLEPISECLVGGLICSLAYWHIFDISPLAFFLVHLLIWFILDYLLLRFVVKNEPLKCNKFDYLMAWLMHNMTTTYITLRAHMNNKVKWRHKVFRLQFGGKIEEINDKYYHV